MITIHKYPLQPEGVFKLLIPSGFRVLTTTTQRSSYDSSPEPVIYIMVDTDKPLEEVEFAVYPTGAQLDPFVARHREYLGLAKIDYGGPYPDLYFHVFGRRSGGSLS